jgi:hypothetical protein
LFLSGAHKLSYTSGLKVATISSADSPRSAVSTGNRIRLFTHHGIGRRQSRGQTKLFRYCLLNLFGTLRMLLAQLKLEQVTCGFNEADAVLNQERA